MPDQNAQITVLEDKIAELRGKLARLNIRLAAAQALYLEAFERLQALEKWERQHG